MLSWSVWRRHENSWTPPQSSSFLLDVRLAVSHQVHFSVSSIRVCLSVTGFTVLSPASGSVCHQSHCSVTRIQNKQTTTTTTKTIEEAKTNRFAFNLWFSSFYRHLFHCSVTSIRVCLSPISLFCYQHHHQLHCSLTSIRVCLSVTSLTVLSSVSGSVCHRFYCSVTGKMQGRRHIYTFQLV